MLCPVDRIPAIVVEYSDIELDYCAKCRGVWFDAGELELLLASAGLGGPGAFMEAILKAPAAGTKEKSHRCPICNLKMEKGYVDRQDGTLVDVCPDGHGIWFDGGEVEALVGSLAAGRHADNPAYNKLIEFFGETLRSPQSNP